MKLLSVNIGKTKSYSYNNSIIRTAFCKEPTINPVKLKLLGLEGDMQTNKKYHGGITKAVYAYDESNYNHWKTVLTNYEFTAGNFGENLVTQGLPDEAAYIGNVYSIGTTLIQAIEPRFPCNRLNFRFNNPQMVKLFAAQACYGIYFKVLQEGIIQVNDGIKLYQKGNSKVSIKDLAVQFIIKNKDLKTIENIDSEPLIPDEVKSKFLKFLK